MKCGDGMRFPRNSELYCERVWERVWESKRELCHIENGYVVSQVREHLQRATEGILSDTDWAVVMWYVQDLSELVSSGEFIS